MKIKIKEGNLLIYREGYKQFIHQICKYDKTTGCGISCPLFDLVVNKIKYTKKIEVKLMLCEDRVCQIGADEFEVEDV
jgi:hypothetical protein